MERRTFIAASTAAALATPALTASGGAGAEAGTARPIVPPRLKKKIIHR